MPSSYVDLHIFSKDGSTELHNATLDQNVYAPFVITQSGYTSNGTAVSVSYGADILGWATTANSSEADFDIDSSYEYHTIFPDADGSSPKTFNYYIVTGSTTYKHILKDGSKVQVDSAIRDGNGVKIDTNYEKLSNKVTSVSSSSTDTQYPSAKLLYDKISDVTEIAEGKTANYVISDASQTGYENASFNATTDTVSIEYTSKKIKDVLGNDINLSDLKVGDIVSITETNVPDRWVGSKTTTGTPTMTFYKLETKITIDSSPTSSSTNPVSSGGVYTALGDKMDKANPTGTGSLKVGTNVTASGVNSTALGTNSVASNGESFASGYQATASGYYSHAENCVTTASGESSHAEGYYTTASGTNSHAEGEATIAQRKSQHAFGENNIADTSGTTTTRGTYIEIVGNGSSSSARSNARTLDWSGNEWIAGNLQASGLTDGTTTKTMTQILAGGGSVDIDNTSITENSSNKIQTVGVIDQKTSSANKQWTGTKAQYDAITTKDANTFYYVTDAVGSAYTKANIDASNLTTSNASSWRQAIIKAQTLWTNPSPTSNFNAQDIVLSSSDYDYLIVKIIINTTETKYINTIVEKGAGTTLLQYSTAGSASGYYIMSQYRDMTYVNDTKYSISANTYGRTGGYATNRQDLNIPFEIIGIKLL